MNGIFDKDSPLAVANKQWARRHRPGSPALQSQISAVSTLIGHNKSKSNQTNLDDTSDDDLSDPNESRTSSSPDSDTMEDFDDDLDLADSGQNTLAAHFVEQTKPKHWSAWKPKVPVPSKLLPSTIKSTWASSLFTNNPKDPQAMTGKGDLHQLEVHHQQDGESGHAESDSNAMYKQALILHPGSMLQTHSPNIHHWVQHKAFVFSMWIKPHGSLNNQLNLLGVKGGSQEALAPQCKLNAIDETVHVFDDSLQSSSGQSFPGVGMDTLFSLPIEQWAHVVLHRVGTKKFRVYLNSYRLGEFSINQLPNWWGDTSKSTSLQLSHHPTNLAGYFRFSSPRSSSHLSVDGYSVYTLKTSSGPAMTIHGVSNDSMKKQFATLDPNTNAKHNFSTLTTSSNDITPMYGNATLRVQGTGRLSQTNKMSQGEMLQSNHTWALSCWLQCRNTSSIDSKSVITLLGYGLHGNKFYQTPGTSMIQLDFANQQVTIESGNVTINVDDLRKRLQGDSSPQWHHILAITNVPKQSRSLYIDGNRCSVKKHVETPGWWDGSGGPFHVQLRVADVQTAWESLDMCLDLPSFYMDIPHQSQNDQDIWAETVYEVQHRMGQNQKSSTDLPMWFGGDEQGSDIEDAHGNNLGDDGSGKWGDSLVKKLYLQQYKSASSKNVSLSRPLYKTVLDASPEGHSARNTIGMLTVFPSYQGANKPSTMLTGGNYGPHANTYGYDAIGGTHQPEVDTDKGLYQSAMALPEGSHLRVRGNNQHANHSPHGKPFTLNQSLSDDSMTTQSDTNGRELRGMSTWIYIEAFPKNVLRVLEIVADGDDPGQVNQVADESGKGTGGSGQNNMQLFVDKPNNQVKLFPNDSKSETARVKVDEVFPRKKWIHVHIARTKDKSFEWFINGYYLFTFTPDNLPTWWGGQLPQYHFGRGEMKVWVDYLMWHHKTLTNAHLNTIIQKSAPSGFQPLKPQTLIPKDLLPSKLASTWSTYLMASYLSRFVQLAHGRQPMPILRAPSTHDDITEITHGVFKGGLKFGSRGTTMGSTTEHMEALLQKSTFVVGLWIKPLVAWNSLSKPLRLLHATAANESKYNNFHIGVDPQHDQITFCSTSTKTSGVTVDIPMSFPLHKWSHIVVYRRSSTKFAVFVNGVNIGETTVREMNLPGILTGMASGSTQTLHIGCMSPPNGSDNDAAGDDDDDESSISIGIDLINFIHHTSSIDPFTDKDIHDLYNTLQTHSSDKTPFATTQPIRKPLFPGAHSLWNKQPNLLYVFPEFTSGAYCFGQFCSYGHQLSTSSSGIHVTSSGSKGVYANALEVTQTTNGATISRGNPPPDATKSMKQWLGQSAFAFTCWLKIPASEWPSETIALFLADSANYTRNSHLQLAINGQNDTLAIMQSADATVKNVGIADKLPTQQWHHIALVRTSATKFTVYMNKQAVHTFSFASADKLPSWWGDDQLKIHVGQTLEGGSDSSVGEGDTNTAMMRLDYITFWDKVLSKDNIKRLIESTAPSGYSSDIDDDLDSNPTSSIIHTNDNTNDSVLDIFADDSFSDSTKTSDRGHNDYHHDIPFRLSSQAYQQGNLNDESMVVLPDEMYPQRERLPRPRANQRNDVHNKKTDDKNDTPNWLMVILFIAAIIVLGAFLTIVSQSTGMPRARKTLPPPWYTRNDEF